MSPPAHATEDRSGPGVTTQLCDWIHGLKLDDVPVHVQTRAKYLILDGIACALTGARVPWSAHAAKAVLEFEEPGKHIVIGYEKASPHSCTYKLASGGPQKRQSTPSEVFTPANLSRFYRKWDRWPQRY